MSPGIGQTIREARKSRGLTQEQLAALLHVSRQTVSHWENGRAEPSYDLLKSLADALEMDIARLFGEAESVPASSPDPHTQDSCALAQSDDLPASDRSAQSAGTPAARKPMLRISGALCAALLAIVLFIAVFTRLQGAYALRWYEQETSVPASAPGMLIYTRQSPIPRKGEGGSGMWEFPLFFKELNGHTFEVTSLRLVWFRKNGTQHTEVITPGEFYAHTGSTVIGPNEIRLITIGKPTHYGFTHFACALTGLDTDGHEYTFRLAIPLQ